jgi:Ni/Fe-hydrogenase subunit HybB-like protein
MRAFKTLLTALALALLIAPGARACPGCKEALADQQGVDSAALRDGYSWSILLMMAAPFGLVSAGGLAIARAVRRGDLPEM